MIEQGTRKISTDTVSSWMERSFYVDPTRGGITWVNPPDNHPRLKGKSAGYAKATRGDKRYVTIKMDGVPLRRSWLIFLWVHKRWPAECIDHIDGNSLNDCISNLREATITQNAWNHSRCTKRSDLPMGVRRISEKRYQARIAVHGITHHLGPYDTPDEARAAYLEKRKEFYHEFA